MAQTTREPVGPVVISGPREGEVVLLDPEIVEQAPRAEEVEILTALNAALDRLNAVLDRFIAVFSASADSYDAATARLKSL